MYGQIFIIYESAWFINKYKTPSKWNIKPIFYGQVRVKLAQHMTY